MSTGFNDERQNPINRILPIDPRTNAAIPDNVSPELLKRYYDHGPLDLSNPLVTIDTIMVHYLGGNDYYIYDAALPLGCYVEFRAGDNDVVMTSQITSTFNQYRDSPVQLGVLADQYRRLQEFIRAVIDQLRQASQAGPMRFRKTDPLEQRMLMVRHSPMSYYLYDPQPHHMADVIVQYDNVIYVKEECASGYGGMLLTFIAHLSHLEAYSVITKSTKGVYVISRRVNEFCIDLPGVETRCHILLRHDDIAEDVYNAIMVFLEQSGARMTTDAAAELYKDVMRLPTLVSAVDASTEPGPQAQPSIEQESTDDDTSPEEEFSPTADASEESTADAPIKSVWWKTRKGQFIAGAIAVTAIVGIVAIVAATKSDD